MKDWRKDFREKFPYAWIEWGHDDQIDKMQEIIDFIESLLKEREGGLREKIEKLPSRIFEAQDFKDTNLIMKKDVLALLNDTTSHE